MYSGYRYPSQVISHAVWLYHRFTLSFRDIEELLAARGITVSYETIRNWCLKFGQQYCNQIRRNRGQLGDTWFLDEVFIKINGVLHYLWRAVDQDGEVVDVYCQAERDGAAARRFLGAHAAVSNLFNLGRHLVSVEHYMNLKISAFKEWSRAVA